MSVQFSVFSVQPAPFLPECPVLTIAEYGHILEEMGIPFDEAG